MNWIGKYIFDTTGQCRWHEALHIQDEAMMNAYRQNTVIEFICETCALVGVKVGMA